MKREKKETGKIKKKKKKRKRKKKKKEKEKGKRKRKFIKLRIHKIRNFVKNEALKL